MGTEWCHSARADKATAGNSSPGPLPTALACMAEDFRPGSKPARGELSASCPPQTALNSLEFAPIPGSRASSLDQGIDEKMSPFSSAKKGGIFRKIFY